MSEHDELHKPITDNQCIMLSTSQTWGHALWQLLRSQYPLMVKVVYGLWGSSTVAVGISCKHSDMGLKLKMKS